jgi:multidrug transporter EmrE-like cation transporter
MKDVWLIFASLFFNVAAQLLLRSAMIAIGSVTNREELIASFPAIVSNVKLWLGVSSFVVSTFFWIMALSKFEVSFAYAFLSLGFVFVTIFAFFVFHEHVTPLRVVGIALICVGIICVSRS